MHKTEIANFIHENRDILRAFGVETLGLFGSFAQGRQTAQSDIDFVVQFQPEKKTYDNFIGLAYFLEDNLERKVDLISRDALSPYLGPHILQELDDLAL